MSQHTPYVLVEEPSGTTGGRTESKNVVRFRGAVSIFTMVLCLLLFITCILALCAIHTWPYTYRRLHYDTEEGVKYNVYNACFSISVLCVYLMIASLLIVGVELKSTTILTPFAALVSPLGRGVLYFLIGFLVFGLAANMGFYVGLMWMINGILHMALGYRSFRSFYYEGTVADYSTSGRRVVQTTTTTRAEVPSSSGDPRNFCKSCGATLTPGAEFCAECSTRVS